MRLVENDVSGSKELAIGRVVQSIVVCGLVADHDARDGAWIELFGARGSDCSNGLASKRPKMRNVRRIPTAE